VYIYTCHIPAKNQPWTRTGPSIKIEKIEIGSGISLLMELDLGI
jgi:hypothetical protein